MAGEQSQPTFSGDCIVARREGPLGIISFDNPDGGFLTADMVSALDRVTREWEEDPALRAVILTGANEGTFVTHYSPHELRDMAEAVSQCQSDKAVLAMRRQAGTALRLVQWASRVPFLYRWLNRKLSDGELGGVFASVNFHRMLMRWQTSGTVYIAAINGFAMGGGFELSLACDFRLMSRGDHVLGLPEAVSGIIPGAGGTQRLARLVGPQRAAAMILTAEMSNADEALDKGLVDGALDAKDLMDEARSLGLQLAGQAPLSVLGVKRAIHEGIDQPMSRASDLEAVLFMNAIVSRDAAAIAGDYQERLKAGKAPVDSFAEYSKGHSIELRGL